MFIRAFTDGQNNALFAYGDFHLYITCPTRAPELADWPRLIFSFDQ